MAVQVKEGQRPRPGEATVLLPRWAQLVISGANDIPDPRKAGGPFASKLFALESVKRHGFLPDPIFHLAARCALFQLAKEPLVVVLRPLPPRHGSVRVEHVSEFGTKRLHVGAEVVLRNQEPPQS